MNTTLYYALLLTGTQVLLNLLSYFTGLQSEHIRHLQYVQWVSLCAIFALLYLGADAKRKERPDRAFTYGQAFAAVFLIGLTFAALNSAANFIHFKFIHPDFADYMIDLTRSQMLERGVPEASIEAAERGQRMMLQPGISTAVSFLATLLAVCLLGLLHAVALVRRRTVKEVLLLNAGILGALGLILGGLGGMMQGGFLLGAAKGLAINIGVSLAGWWLLLRFTGYAPDAPPEEPSL